jgi:hypothetical protein
MARVVEDRGYLPKNPNHHAAMNYGLSHNGSLCLNLVPAMKGTQSDTLNFRRYT